MKTLLTTLHSKYVHASLALPCLAAYCDDTCGELLIREYTVNEPKESVLAQIVANEAEVVCFSVYLWNRVVTLELVNCLKQIDEKIKIVLGGPEVSFEETDFFNRYPVDALICGEGEIPLRHLLTAWQKQEGPSAIAGLRLPDCPYDDGQSVLDSLDCIPSPFAAGLVDLTRGLVYYESSRGCPYTCSFCMSALDHQVRSFSIERIKSDLDILMARGVPQIKFVDRTFNYDNRRAREIFKYILQHNRSSHFHFEIGAHLLEEKTMDLLETVPDGVFQFEIGVQSTLPETLRKVGRQASLERLSDNVSRLINRTGIHLHLDLIAGLPGENYQQFLKSIDFVSFLNPDHLQIEPVKLLPGAPLRQQAETWGIRYDPNPPYTILHSRDLNFFELDRLRGIGRLLDLLVNSRRFTHLLPVLMEYFSRLSLLLEDLDDFWRGENLYQCSRSLSDLYLEIDHYLQKRFTGEQRAGYRELLGRDFAHHQRVVGGSAPDFFNISLDERETEAVRKRVKQELSEMERDGKVQFFASVFDYLPESPGRTILIFLYITNTSKGLQVEELKL